LTPDVVDAVATHMNEDHREDLLVMVAGQVPGAVAAEVTGLDSQSLRVQVVDGSGTSRHVALPWPEPLTQRSDIRKYVVQMYEQAQGDS
jgi:hypothetical protein